VRINTDRLASEFPKLMLELPYYLARRTRYLHFTKPTMPRERSGGILGQGAQMHADMQTSDMSILSPKRQRVISGDEKGQRVGNGTEKDIVDFNYLKAGDANAAIKKLEEQDASIRKPGDKRRRWGVMYRPYKTGGGYYQIIKLPPSDPLDNGTTVSDAEGSEDESLKMGGRSIVTSDAKTTLVDTSLMTVVTTEDGKSVATAGAGVDAESSGKESERPSAFDEAIAQTGFSYSSPNSEDGW
jgi:hypothetical protein